jgi:transcription elongation factor SPT5
MTPAFGAGGATPAYGMGGATPAYGMGGPGGGTTPMYGGAGARTPMYGGFGASLAVAAGALAHWGRSAAVRLCQLFAAADSVCVCA